MADETSAEVKKIKKPAKSRLLKAPIRVRSEEGREDEYIDYFMEVDKERIYIVTDHPHPVKTKLNLALELHGSGRPIFFRGEVVRINSNKPDSPDGLEPGMGIVFERVSFDNRKLIAAYLDKVQSAERSEDYSMFLSWVQRISRPMGTKERERIKRDLLKVLYGATKEGPETPGARKRKSIKELEILGKIDLFAEMDDLEIEEIARSMLKEKFRAGDAIFDEGDVGDKMYVVVTGAVNIIKTAETGPGQVLVTLKDGDFFGEMSLIDDAPRSASAMAAEDLTLLSVKKKDLALLLDASPAIAAKIYKFFVITLNQRLRETNDKIKHFVSLAQEISQA